MLPILIFSFNKLPFVKAQQFRTLGFGGLGMRSESESPGVSTPTVALLKCIQPQRWRGVKLESSTPFFYQRCLAFCLLVFQLPRSAVGDHATGGDYREEVGMYLSAGLCLSTPELFSRSHWYDPCEHQNSFFWCREDSHSSQEAPRSKGGIIRTSERCTLHHQAGGEQVCALVCLCDCAVWAEYRQKRCATSGCRW